MKYQILWPNRWLQHVWIIIKVTKLLAKERSKANKLTNINNKLDILATLCFELERGLNACMRELIYFPRFLEHRKSSFLQAVSRMSQ